MIHRASWICLAWAVLASCCAGAAAIERIIMPFELGRSLQMLQEAVANGNETAQNAQQKLLAIMSSRFLAADPAVWKDGKNANAAILHALSGGDPMVLKTLIDHSSFAEKDLPLAKGTLAYSEGRSEDASSLLGGIDALTVAPSIGGYVALAQSVLATPKDPAKASRLLAKARLLMPGTLVEEAALRREILMAVQDGEIEKFERLSRQQLTRYGRSIYTSGFRNQFADAVVNLDYGREPNRLDILESMLGTLQPSERRDLYLLVARKAVFDGKTAIARFAAERAAASPESTQQEKMRAELYSAAALIVTDDFDPALRRLRAIDATKLAKEDSRLLLDALALAGRVRRRPDPSIKADPSNLPRRPQQPDEKPVEDPLPEIVNRASKAIARADELLQAQTP